MPDDHEKRAVARRQIAAAPQAIFDVLADPSNHPVIDGSGTVRASRGGQSRLALGSAFGMRMRLGLPYLIRNRVVEFEEGRRIAWQHFAHNVWRYELEPVDGGTQVTETFDWSRGRLGPALHWMQFPERNQAGMERTLERLDKLVTTGLAD